MPRESLEGEHGIGLFDAFDLADVIRDQLRYIIVGFGAYDDDEIAFISASSSAISVILLLLTFNKMMNVTMMPVSVSIVEVYVSPGPA